MWSSKLSKSLKALGHECVILPSLPKAVEPADAAVVNLGQPQPDPAKLVEQLHALDIFVIGHAGHKESSLMTLGQEIKVDILATNSELTFKIEEILSRVPTRP